MRNIIYTIALLAVIVCVFMILVAPDYDLPDSTVLRAKDGLHLMIISIDLALGLFLLVLLILFMPARRKRISTRFDSPSSSSLCSFLC